MGGMFEVFTDGGSRGNPGKAAFGFVVKKNSQTIKEGRGFIGIATNNFAEYTALYQALKWLSKNSEGVAVKVFSDSQLVVAQLNGVFKVKNATIRDLLFKVRELESHFPQITYMHIPRQQNSQADKLVNIALDEQWN